MLYIVLLTAVIITLTIIAISYNAYDAITDVPKKLYQKKPCTQTTLSGYLDLPERASAQTVPPIYRGDKETDYHMLPKPDEFVYDSRSVELTGYTTEPADYVFSPQTDKWPKSPCFVDRQVCLHQGSQCMTNLSQLDNMDNTAIYQKVNKVSTTHKPGYTRTNQAAYI